MIDIRQAISITDLKIQLSQGHMIYDMGDHIYHNKECPGITRSMLNEFAKAPIDFIHGQKNPSQKKQTDEMIFGTNFHHASLFPKTFRENHVVIPKLKGVRGNTIADQLAKIESENPNKILIEQEDLDRIYEMHDSLTRHRSFTDYFLNKDSYRETTFFHDHKGILFRVKPDIAIIPQSGSVKLIDIKTCKKGGAEKHEFSKYLYGEGRLYAQAALYSICVASALKLDHQPEFIFLAIEKEPPYKIATHKLSDEYFQWACDKILYEMDYFKECALQDKWPSYPDEIQSIELPYFLKNK